MLWFLIALPVVAGLLAFAMPWNGPRRALLAGTAFAHTCLVTLIFVQPPAPVLYGWIALDATSALFLGITSFIFLITAFYAVGYLARERRRTREQPGEELPFANYPEATFTGCCLLFLAAMTLVVVSQHWGLMWVAVEATTLASAPLIYFHRTPKSLEATWKYLVICSVGIALALLGNFFLAVAAKACAGEHLHLGIAEMENHARQLDPLWLKGAFLLLLVGYGTKMGLAPMHTWLPDAHSEAPSIISALLSGVLLNCAFLAILRGHSLLVKAGLGAFSQDLLVLFGLISMVVAGLFIIGQFDYKRLLAYSSVEHMGILVLGVGIGGIAGFGSMLHAVNHSVAKAMLFMAAGNTLAYFHTKSTLEARGLLRVLPVTGFLWIVGLLAITGSPPFGTFLSEFTVLKGMIDGGRIFIAVFYLIALSIVFVGMSAVILPIVYGKPIKFTLKAALHSQSDELGPLETPSATTAEETWWSLVPPLLLAVAALVLGLYLPRELTDLLHRAAITVGAE
jgi:hydrogenase-4 component F